ncbi:hypothetical protein SAMN05421688_1226 [Poseidonocella pacifica]|uniref:Component of SufBCD complex n=1 Tax=Poseidonocella pacifica TaxID=871651 RepID=A0A1I0WB22_9RHOB|nr:hypothetical protein [Poseidonocella pacifica]SFA85919.1 hypothetical protein SAMN05421688_1226 [Poseidonocella pacifica]
MNSLIELIDTRSFASLWYWLLLALVWTGAANWGLGAPVDMLLRARRLGGGAQDELETSVAIQSRRQIRLAGGPVTLGVLAFVSTMLALLGFLYGWELGQAVFLLIFPLILVRYMALRTAHRILRGNLQGDALHDVIGAHRFRVQVLSVIALFATALFGMYQNLVSNPFGG